MIRRLRALTQPERSSHDRIAEARAAVGRAHLDLLWELQSNCPGQHSYSNHANGQWCCYCGYDRDGKRISTTPCADAERSREDA